MSSLRLRHILRKANRLGSQLQVAGGIEFDAKNRLALDIYAPSGKPSDRPVIMLWHGGSWQRGSRHDLGFVAGVLASEGYIVVTPSYRLYPRGVFPSFVQDAASALSWTAKHIKKYGGDPHNLFLAGHSAGAQIAAMLAIDPQYMERVGVNPRDVKGCILLAVPATYVGNLYKPIFGPGGRKAFLPADVARNHKPRMPYLLIHGKLDPIVPFEQGQAFAQLIRGQGGIAEMQAAPLAEHMLVIAAYAPGLWRLFAPSHHATIDFIERYRSK